MCLAKYLWFGIKIWSVICPSLARVLSATVLATICIVYTRIEIRPFDIVLQPATMPVKKLLTVPKCDLGPIQAYF